MYDIVTLEPGDPVVMTAVNAIRVGQGAIPGPNGQYRLIVPGGVPFQEGNGGVNSHVLVVVAHGNANSLSGRPTWAQFRNDVGHDAVDWGNKTQVYIAACSAAQGGGQAFLHGNIANEVRAFFPPNVTVWASSNNVDANTQNGDWQQL